MTNTDKFYFEYKLFNCDTKETITVIDKKPRSLTETTIQISRKIQQYDWDDFTGIETPFLLIEYSIYDILDFKQGDPTGVYAVKSIENKVVDYE